MAYEFDQETLPGDHYLMSAGKVTAPSILDALSDAGIFHAEPKDSGHVQFTDGCDEVYSLSLNQEQLLAFSDEIRELANSLKG
ncbi:hypothetical protein [Marinobacter sp.]|uniref:hypothetical protein n=1 Tax=Marinobacter sp. TaxID=50741 RepID=UPI0035670A1F